MPRATYGSCYDRRRFPFCTSAAHVCGVGSMLPGARYVLSGSALTTPSAAYPLGAVLHDAPGCDEAKNAPGCEVST
eukprot:1057628-Amphidinium_carterae.1